MTLEECYIALGGNYREALERLMNTTLLSKFLNKFLADDNFSHLCSAIEKNDFDAAFKASHALKGVSSNMAFTNLTNSVSALTENLRGLQGDEHTLELFHNVEKDYTVVKESILAFQASSQEE